MGDGRTMLLLGMFFFLGAALYVIGDRMSNKKARIAFKVIGILIGLTPAVLMMITATLLAV